MKYSEIKCIDSSWIDAEVERLKLELTELPENRRPLMEILSEEKIFKLIKSKLIDATPILAETWTASNKFSNNVGIEFEQFLNTEVKTIK